MYGCANAYVYVFLVPTTTVYCGRCWGLTTKAKRACHSRTFCRNRFLLVYARECVSVAGELEEPFSLPYGSCLSAFELNRFFLPLRSLLNFFLPLFLSFIPSRNAKYIKTRSTQHAHFSVAASLYRYTTARRLKKIA